MSLANARWGAPRIHGELLKLGIQVSQATVAKYMVRHRKPPSQSWRTFLKNHAKDLVSADFFIVPTIAFQLLFVFVILDQDRRLHRSREMYQFCSRDLTHLMAYNGRRFPHALQFKQKKSLISSQIFLDCHRQVHGLFARACWFVARDLFLGRKARPYGADLARAKKSEVPNSSLVALL